MILNSVTLISLQHLNAGTRRFHRLRAAHNRLRIRLISSQAGNCCRHCHRWRHGFALAETSLAVRDEVVQLVLRQREAVAPPVAVPTSVASLTADQADAQPVVGNPEPVKAPGTGVEVLDANWFFARITAHTQIDHAAIGVGQCANITDDCVQEAAAL